MFYIQELIEDSNRDASDEHEDTHDMDTVLDRFINTAATKAVHKKLLNASSTDIRRVLSKQGALKRSPMTHNKALSRRTLFTMFQSKNETRQEHSWIGEQTEV